MAKHKTIQWYERQINKDNNAIFTGNLAKNLNSQEQESLYAIALYNYYQEYKLPRIQGNSVIKLTA